MTAKVSVVLAGMVAILSATAHAESKTDKTKPAKFTYVEVGLFGGYHFYDSDNDLGDISFQNPLEDAPILGLRAAVEFVKWFGVEAEVGWVPTEGGLPRRDYRVIDYRGHGIVHFLHGKVRPFALVGAGLQTGRRKNADGDNDTSMHFGIGSKYLITPNIGVRGDLRMSIVPTQGSGGGVNGGRGTDFELLVGAYWRFGIQRKTDKQNKAALDPDGDGVVGSLDRCPNQKEDPDGFEDSDGCPDDDNDGDGVADIADKCPTEKERINKIDDDDGCPEVDSDGDMVLGSQDKCPDRKEDVDGFEDSDGCPDDDNDGDGVPDASDKCPEQKETRNGYQDADGCADEVPEEIGKFSGAIRGVRFGNDSAVIWQSSFAVLNRAAAALKKYPSLRVEIAGHTDSAGSEARNRELSQLRAQAVLDYLVKKGVDAGRLTAKGYGPDKPVATNDTPAGRNQNRRVEFVLQK